MKKFTKFTDAVVFGLGFTVSFVAVTWVAAHFHLLRF